MPPEGSTISSDVDALFYFLLYASIVFFVIVVGLMTFFVVRYRRKKHAAGTRTFDYNLPLEITWTAIPLVLVLIVFFWGFHDYMRLNIVPKGALEVKVTGQKWFWSFAYPEGATSVNELVVPVDKPIKLLISSKDVIHSFYVPSFRIKMDAVPNRYTIAWFQAKRPGEYQLFCAEYCGKGHSEMIGKVKVLSEREYGNWLETSSASGEGMKPADYGAKLYQSKACITCHSVDGSAGTGPTFLGLYGEQQKLEGGSSVLVDENYVRESILNPMAKVVLGYQPVMPTFQGLLSDKEVDALIAYIKSLQEKESE